MELSADELRAAAQRARARLEAAGEIDRVWEQQGVGADAAPAFDSLLGKTIEVRWRYYTTENGERKQVCACLPKPCPSPAKGTAAGIGQMHVHVYPMCIRMYI